MVLGGENEPELAMGAGNRGIGKPSAGIQPPTDLALTRTQTRCRVRLHPASPTSYAR